MPGTTPVDREATRCVAVVTHAEESASRANGSEYRMQLTVRRRASSPQAQRRRTTLGDDTTCQSTGTGGLGSASIPSAAASANDAPIMNAAPTPAWSHT